MQFAGYLQAVFFDILKYFLRLHLKQYNFRRRPAGTIGWWVWESLLIFHYSS